MSDHATQAAQTAPEAKSPAKPRRRRHPYRGTLVILALLLVAVWFAPAIVAKTSLRDRIARTAGADLNGTLDIGDASLGWLSPIELRDVTLTDAKGRVVARIPKVTSGRTLLSLARDHSAPGEFVIDHPNIDVVCRADGTNLEDVLRKLLDDVTPPGPTRTPVTVKVVGGMLTLRDTETGRFGEFRDIAAVVVLPASRSEPVTLKVSADAPGKVEADVSIGEAGRVKVTANGLALETLAPLLRRVDPGLAVAGSASADLTATWGKDAATIDGTLGVKNLAVTAAELKGDTVRMASVSLPLKASLTGRTLQVERAELTTDVGTVSVVGTFTPDSLDKLLDHPGVRLDADVDVAKLAAVLPKLLQVREGTEFREGRLVVKVESKASEGGASWVGSVNMSALRATRDGKEIRWEEPLAIEFAGRVKVGELPTFDKLVCRSDFVAINAKVSPNSIHAGMNVYLDRLAARLADFVDLGGVALDGRGTARVIADRTPTGEFTLDASADLTKFACTDRSGTGLREPTLSLQLKATGKAPDGGPVSVRTASLRAGLGKDEVQLSLLEPIADAAKLTGGKFDATVTGDLGRWKDRVATAVPVLKDYEMGGAAAAKGVVRLAGESFHVDRLSLNLDNARFVGAGLDINEPNMKAVADLTVDRKARVTTFAEFTIDSKPLAVTRGKLVIETPKNGQTVVYGGGPAVTHLNHLGRSVGMFLDPAGPSAMYGIGTGPIQFRYSGDVTTFGGTLDVANFLYGLRAEPVMREPTLRLETDGSYTRSTDTLAFKSAKVERPGLAVAGSGTMAHFETTTDTNLTGTITYDLVKLTPMLRESIGGGFEAVGTGTKPFSFAGSLTPLPRPGSTVAPSLFAAATGELCIGWDAAHAYGMTMGQGQLQMKLAGGMARVEPINATFGDGKVSVQPTVRMAPKPREVTLANGLIVDRAKLTPVALAGAVGYVLPPLANSGKAEGEVSLRLDENRIPLNDPRQATVKGTLVIHKATVTAGPVVTEIAKLLGADSGTMTLSNEQAVPVRIEGGRVRHENLNIKVGGYVVKTTGSVGFDNTIDLTADVPIPGGLPGLKNTPAIAKALQGKRVNVPIKGTLTHPMLDPKAFQAAIAKLAQDAGKEIGKSVLDRELGKLFPEGLPTAPPGAGGTKPGGLFPFSIPGLKK